MKARLANLTLLVFFVASMDTVFSEELLDLSSELCVGKEEICKQLNQDIAEATRKVDKQTLEAIERHTNCEPGQSTYELVSLSGGKSEADQALYKYVLGFDLVRKVTLGDWSCTAPDFAPDMMLSCSEGDRTLFIAMGGAASHIAIPLTPDGPDFL